jgi:hypothetical protein
MKASEIIPVSKWFIILTAIMMNSACSGHYDNIPTPARTKAQMLVEDGKWITTGATLKKDDGTAITIPANDPFFDTILLGDVTFYADGTAIESNDPNGLTKDGLKWTLTGSNLLVSINYNNTDKVSAVITFLSDNKLVMEVTDFYDYNDVIYTRMIQTLTH